MRCPAVAALAAGCGKDGGRTVGLVETSSGRPA